MLEILGKRIKAIREDHDDTQSQLAEKLHVVWHTVASWEQSKSSPSYETLAEFCKIYDVASDYLIGLTEDPTPNHRTLGVHFTKESIAALHQYEQFLLWQQQKNEHPRAKKQP